MSLPGEVLEQVLAHVPFQERVRAMAVCQAWRQHLLQPRSPLWQAARIGTIAYRVGGVEEQLRLFLPLQRWLRRHGGGLLQLQCSTSFSRTGHPNTELLTAFLMALGAAAPSLQALRLDGSAAGGLSGAGLVGITGMGDRLRQLALVGLNRVSDKELVAALPLLPKLQDLAIMYVDERDARLRWDEGQDCWVRDDGLLQRAPDFMWLLARVTACCQGLRSLALGHLPRDDPGDAAPWGDVVRNEEPLPASMSRLTALSSLALHNVCWEYAPDGLPHLPRLRRLSLRGDHDEESHQPGIIHQLSTLTGLEALQASLPMWLGRLPPGLTQLVLAPLKVWEQEVLRADDCASCLQVHLPTLRGLRHLAFHHLHEAGARVKDVCAAAAALPQLLSLHLVGCNLWWVPKELCELSRLELLNLSYNPLQHDGYVKLAKTPLHKLTSCRLLDLQYGDSGLWPTNTPLTPLEPAVTEAITSMPALEQLALPRAYKPSPKELAELAERRGPGMPRIRVVSEMPESDHWGAVSAEVPFAAVNEVLGVQLDRSISRGVVLNNVGGALDTI